MKGIVVIPAANRPELLALTLEGLSNAPGCPDDVRIYIDYPAKDSLDTFAWVRDNYLPTADLYLAKPHIAAPSGCWNILNSIKQGYESGADIIYMIEEDVRVFPNYFPYAKAAIAAGYPAALGRATPMNRNNGPVYTNPGSALSRSTAEKVVRHINDDYFTRLRAYLDEHFGVYPNYSDLDDGLIRRIILADKGECMVPETPKAAHLGFYFYNKLDIYVNREGTIQEKIERARELFRTVKVGDRYSRDFEPF
jgi:hypothetical protein